MVVSSVSPDRCEMTLAYPAVRAISMASSVCITVPIWLSFTSSAFCDALLDALPEDRRVRHEDIVADELHARAQRGGQPLPARPVAFGETVLDRDDGVLADPVLVDRDHVVRGLQRLRRISSAS